MMSEIVQDRKEREFIPDIQHNVNECRDTANRISNLVSKLSNSMTHPSTEPEGPEKPKDREPTTLEGLVESSESLAQRLRNVE